MPTLFWLKIISVLLSVNGVSIRYNDDGLYATKMDDNNSDDVFYSVQMNVFDSWWDWVPYSGINNQTETYDAIHDLINENITQYIVFRFFELLY